MELRASTKKRIRTISIRTLVNTTFSLENKTPNGSEVFCQSIFEHEEFHLYAGWAGRLRVAVACGMYS